MGYFGTYVQLSDHPRSPSIAKALTTAYFLVICLIGISPSKGFSIAARAIICLSIAHACSISRFNFASWISSRQRAWLFFLLQLIGWLVLIPIEFYSFEFNNFDTGIFANNILHWCRTGEYYSTILGMHAFADHFTPNLLLLSPLFALWDSFVWLPLIKVCAWAWSIVLIAGLARDVLGAHSPYRYLVPGIYLLNQFVANTLLMEFQPSSLAVPFVILAFRFAYNDRLWQLVATLVALLGFKEHLGVVWIAIGLFLAFERKRIRFGACLIACGTLEGLLIYKLLMPLFANGIVHHDTRIAPLNGLAKKASLLAQAFLSFGLLPLCHRFAALYSLPGFILVLMGGEPSMQSFNHHYHDIGFALLACSSILGLRSLAGLEARDPLLTQRLVNVVAIIVLAHAIRFPTFYIRREWPTKEMLEIHRDLPAIKRFINQYEPDEVWTLDHLGPYFAEQANLRSITKPELPDSPRADSRRIVIVSPLVNSYPLWKREYQALERYLERNHAGLSDNTLASSKIKVFYLGAPSENQQ